jgi:hypothetical protein
LREQFSCGEIDRLGGKVLRRATLVVTKLYFKTAA